MSSIPHGQHCVLGTNLTQNVKFYQRLGFHVIGEHDATDLGGVHSWVMMK